MKAIYIINGWFSDRVALVNDNTETTEGLRKLIGEEYFDKNVEMRESSNSFLNKLDGVVYSFKVLCVDNYTTPIEPVG